MFNRIKLLTETFLIEEKITRLSDDGRTVDEFKSCGEMLALIDTVKPHEVEKLKGFKHNVSHVLISRENAAQIGDRLTSGDKVFYVKHVEPIRRFFLYYCSRRWDL